jgi:hypothetical protein
MLGPCSSGDSTEVAAAPNAGAGAGNQVTTVLTGSRGWGTSQSLIVVVCLLTLALLILPPVAWRRFAGTKE